MKLSTKREAAILMQYAKLGGAVDGVGIAARGMSALIRSAPTTTTANILVSIASGIPAVVQHTDFIVSVKRVRT